MALSGPLLQQLRTLVNSHLERRASNNDLTNPEHFDELATLYVTKLDQMASTLMAHEPGAPHAGTMQPLRAKFDHRASVKTALFLVLAVITNGASCPDDVRNAIGDVRAIVDAMLPEALEELTDEQAPQYVLLSSPVARRSSASIQQNFVDINQTPKDTKEITPANPCRRPIRVRLCASTDYAKSANNVLSHDEGKAHFSSPHNTIPGHSSRPISDTPSASSGVNRFGTRQNDTVKGEPLASRDSLIKRPDRIVARKTDACVGSVGSKKRRHSSASGERLPHASTAYAFSAAKRYKLQHPPLPDVASLLRSESPVNLILPALRSTVLNVSPSIAEDTPASPGHPLSPWASKSAATAPKTPWPLTSNHTLRVFSSLDVLEVVRVGGVCRSFWRLTKQHATLYRRVTGLSPKHLEHYMFRALALSGEEKIDVSVSLALPTHLSAVHALSNQLRRVETLSMDIQLDQAQTCAADLNVLLSTPAPLLRTLRLNHAFPSILSSKLVKPSLEEVEMRIAHIPPNSFKRFRVIEPQPFEAWARAGHTSAGLKDRLPHVQEIWIDAPLLVSDKTIACRPKTLKHIHVDEKQADMWRTLASLDINGIAVLDCTHPRYKTARALFGSHSSIRALAFISSCSERLSAAFEDAAGNLRYFHTAGASLAAVFVQHPAFASLRSLSLAEYLPLAALSDLVRARSLTITCLRIVVGGPHPHGHPSILRHTSRIFECPLLCEIVLCASLQFGGRYLVRSGVRQSLEAVDILHFLQHGITFQGRPNLVLDNVQMKGFEGSKIGSRLKDISRIHALPCH